MVDDPDTRDTDEKVGEPADADVKDRDEQDEVDDIDAPGKAEGQPKGRLAHWRHRIARRRLSRAGSALAASALIVATLAGLAGWLTKSMKPRHSAIYSSRLLARAQ
jgi:Mce-associated membrane protein